MKRMFTEQQQKLIQRVCDRTFHFDALTDDDLVEIEEKTGDHLTLHCLDGDYSPNEEGVLCERILEQI